LGWWISLPGVQDWWRNRPTPFSAQFTAFVDECILTPTVDLAAAKRWHDFLRAPVAPAESRGALRSDAAA
jgi:hypothetical protein